jgi:ribosomal-protein-alanine N-acetyltransferase
LVRTLAPEDLPAVLEIQQACPEAAQWTSGDYQSCFAAGSGWVALVAEKQGVVAGFVVGRTLGASEFEILNLAVAREFRRGGVGTQLLRGLAERLRRLGQWERAHAEVRESNRVALSFYTQHGFRVVGRRRGYYSAPLEDALLLALEFPGPAE